MNTNACKQWLNYTQNKGFNQLIKDSTRITESSSTTIDHIYTNQMKNISGHGVLPIALSDHKPIYFKRKLNFQIKNKNGIHKVIKFHDYKDIDLKLMESQLNCQRFVH